MNNPNITWKVDCPEAAYSSLTGIDQYGNKYFTPAHRETVTITSPDGRKAIGWTVQEALAGLGEG